MVVFGKFFKLSEIDWNDNICEQSKAAFFEYVEWI